MKRLLLSVALLGSIAAHAASTDYIVEPVTNGINLYVVSNTRTTMTSGSPYTPYTPLQQGNGEGWVTEPSFWRLSANHKTLYAIYTNQPNTQVLLVSYETTATGLVQNWQVMLPNQGGGTQGLYIYDLQVQGNYLVLPMQRSGGSGILTAVELVSAVNGSVVMTYNGTIANNLVTQYTALQFSPTESLYYLCQQVTDETTGINSYQFEVFSLPKNKLLYTVTDPLQFSGECYVAP